MTITNRSTVDEAVAELQQERFPLEPLHSLAESHCATHGCDGETASGSKYCPTCLLRIAKQDENFKVERGEHWSPQYGDDVDEE